MMHAFTKALPRFREIVRQRGDQLRKLPFEELAKLADEPIQHVVVEKRQGTISLIVQPLSSGALRIVVQGFLKARFVPVKDVAIDGFYKYRDGTVAPMPAEEFYKFD